MSMQFVVKGNLTGAILYGPTSLDFADLWCRRYNRDPETTTARVEVWPFA